MNIKKIKTNLKTKNLLKFFNPHSITLKLLLLLFLLITVETVVFMYFLHADNFISKVDLIAMQTETLNPINLSLSIRKIIYTTIATTAICGSIVAIIITKIFTSPLNNIINTIKEIDSIHPIAIEKTNISELDELIKLIETLSLNSSNTASKISDVLDVAGRSMAIFEVYEKVDKVYITKNLFRILEETDTTLYKTGLIPGNLFRAKMTKLQQHLVQIHSTKNSSLFHIERERDSSKWIRITIIQDHNKDLGLVEDITDEMLKKTKMEFERDYDVLTSLLNRRAFHSTMQNLFSNPNKLNIGAMLSIDLDNLKIINDKYGHDYGDEYIRSLSNVLNVTCRKNTIISRVGGDEFSVFMFGYESKEKLRAEIIRLNIAINNKTLNLPNETPIHLSASIGISWYPTDSTSYNQLIKFADFAMYSIKKTTKGASADFVLRNYEKNSFLIGMSDSLEEFIKNKMFEYTFQPIINAKTGTIFAYKALIKSKHPSIKNPKQLFELARSRTELYELEKLTWNESLNAFESLSVLPSIKLFINSISDQILKTEDNNSIQRNFCHLLKQVVIEVSDAANVNLDYTKSKLNFIHAWGGDIAIGDYGTGSYDEDSLNSLSPKYLKVNLSITQNLYNDENRHKLVKSIVTFAHQRNISVIAEGIEKPEDMFSLIDIGVDYLQGYHICKPTSKPPKILAITTAQISNYNKRKAEQLLSQPKTATK